MFLLFVTIVYSRYDIAFILVFLAHTAVNDITVYQPLSGNEPESSVNLSYRKILFIFCDIFFRRLIMDGKLVGIPFIIQIIILYTFTPKVHEIGIRL